jgi:dolichol-phosphate mannosyltransferase
MIATLEAAPAISEGASERDPVARRLSIILPTYNERESIFSALERIDFALAATGLPYEIIVVDDDSPDGTWERVESLARVRRDLRLIRRLGRRGLSSAVVEGFSAARGELLVVMDADLQHDAGVLPAMVHAAGEPGVDLVVATRYSLGGTTGDWTIGRRLLSRLATILAWSVVWTRVSDPMSGYFLIASHAWREASSQLNPRGFKILLEIIARSPQIGCREIGYTFRSRLHGESKLNGGVGIAYLRALYDLSFNRMMTLGALSYCLVGASTSHVGLALLRFLHRLNWSRGRSPSALPSAVGQQPAVARSAQDDGFRVQSLHLE